MNHLKKYINCAFAFIIVCASLICCTSGGDQHKQNQVFRKNLSEKLAIIKNEDSLGIFLQQFIKDKNYLGAVLSYREIGKMQREKSRFSDAIVTHQKGLDLALIINDTFEIVQALNNLGTDFRRIGALSEASEYHYKALSYSESYSGLKTPEGMKNRVVAMNGIGNICLTLGYDSDAEKYFRMSLQDEKVLGSPIGQAINLANLGAIFEKQQQLDSAQKYYEWSLEQNRIGGSDMGIGLCINHLGDIYRQQNKYGQAKAEYKKAYDLMEKISDKWHWLGACISIAEINLITGDTKNFNRYIRLAEETAKQIKSPEHFSRIYALKHDYAIKKRDFPQALNYYKLSKTLQDSIQGIQKAHRYMDLRINYERDKNMRNLQDVESQNKAKQEEKQRMLYILWIIVFMGIIASGIMYYAYIQRTRTNRMLEKLERMRSDFFMNITHEFRTPITVIHGLNRQMQEKKDVTEKEKVAYMDAIDRQSKNLLNLVNQLLDIAKLKGGIDIPEWKHGDIVPYLFMLSETFRLYAEEKNINLIFYAEIASQKMDFIPFYIDKIINNLLSNAIKHSEKGDKINFIVTAANNSGTIVIRIVDNGEGISPEEIDRIFEMFYQSHNSVNNSGTGIGLAFTKMMVEKMGGKIEVESQLGRGSVFTVTLPVKNKQLSYIPLLDIKEQKEYISIQKQTESVLPEKQIIEEDEETDISSALPLVLVVEDNKDILLYIKSSLQGTYNIITARNGKAGLDMAEKYIPDLVITDVMMPVKDGYEFCSDMKKNRLLNHIPIIIITAKSSDEDRITALRCGGEAYIRKPFHTEELMLKIENILENRKLLINKYLNAIYPSNSEDKLQLDDNLKFLRRVTDIITSQINIPEMNSAFLADKMEMSPSQLNRKINGITGYSTTSYLLQVRLSKAKKMLRETTFSMNEISYICGFCDSSYFSRIFKRQFGVSPSQYQKDSDTVIPEREQKDHKC